MERPRLMPFVWCRSMYSVMGNASQSGSGMASTSRRRSDNPLATTRSPLRKAMPFTSDSGRPCRCARSSSTKVSSPSPSTTTSNGLVASTCSGTAVPCSPPSTRRASGNFSRIVRATRWVSGHKVLNMHVIPMTRLSGWIRPTISSGVSPCTMKSARSG